MAKDHSIWQQLISFQLTEPLLRGYWDSNTSVQPIWRILSSEFLEQIIPYRDIIQLCRRHWYKSTVAIHATTRKGRINQKTKQIEVDGNLIESDACRLSRDNKKKSSTQSTPYLGRRSDRWFVVFQLFTRARSSAGHGRSDDDSNRLRPLFSPP